MAEFLLLPEAFVRYVTKHRRIPMPIDVSTETLGSVIETVCLEGMLDAPSEGAPELTHPQPAS